MTYDNKEIIALLVKMWDNWMMHLLLVGQSFGTTTLKYLGKGLLKLSKLMFHDLSNHLLNRWLI